MFKLELKKAAKEHICQKCGKPILKGQSYIYVLPKYMPPFRRCINNVDCFPRAKDITNEVIKYLKTKDIEV